VRITIEDLLKFDRETVTKKILDFIKYHYENSGVKKLIVGVSGGVDSSTTVYLCTRAVGPENIIALIMPDSRTTPEVDIKDAIDLVSALKIEYRIIYIDELVDQFSEKVSSSFGRELSYKTVGNIRARTRAVLLYTVANEFNGLVVGASDKSELLIGYFTKYGDGAVDILPLGDLYKTQVRALAVYLGVPERIAYKPSSPRLWPGHMAEEELGVRYEEVDLVLHAVFDRGIEPERVPEVTGVPKKVVDKVLEMVRTTEHKRRTPPIAKIFTT